MTFLAPLALVALLVAPLIYVIHWLWGSRRRLRVSAVFLWADLPRAATGRARRRWPPLTVLLVLQLLAAILAALALARPVTSSDPPRHLALVLDASASMQATDVSPTRFDAARARGLERIRALRTSDLVSLVRAGRDASLLASGAPDAVRAALGTTQPGTGGAAIREALALASSQVTATPERRGEIVVLTDAAWPPLDPVGPLAAPVEVVAVGGGSENQAVTSLQVRMDPTGRGQTAFVEVANEADHAVRVPMLLTADGGPIDQRQVDLPARGRTRLSIPLPVDARHVSLRLQAHDSLALDDQVDALAPGGPPREVLLLGRVSDAVRRALESVPSLQVHSADPSAALPAQASLTVLERSLPAQLPAGPLLLIDPPSNSARLLGVGLGSGARVQPDHPLLQGLDLAALQDESPSVGGVPGWARVVLGTLQGPLIMEGRLEGRPAVALMFDPSVSGLEKSLAFPLLVSNASSFLLAQTESTATAALTTEPFDPAESDIAPRPIPTLSSATQTVQAAGGVSEQWPWLIAIGLVVLGAEWLVFAKRG
ncbi:MAG: VWA domain-containing protein [Chloroflexota bacterium]|nr:VWA domain-containing protein [Chloroflexota bacterium]